MAHTKNKFPSVELYTKIHLVMISKSVIYTTNYISNGGISATTSRNTCTYISFIDEKHTHSQKKRKENRRQQAKKKA